MRKKRTKMVTALPKRIATAALSLALVVSNLQFSTATVMAAETDPTAGMISYNIDFGPREDSSSGTPQLETTGRSAAKFEEEAVAGTVRSTFQLGHGDMLYETHVDDVTGLHWGFDKEVASGNTANGGAYFRDWVYAGDSGNEPYTFKADLPTGDYFVLIYNGIKEGDENNTKLIFGNEVLETGNTAIEEKDGQTVYVQDNNVGSQYPDDNSIYYVSVEENPNALSTLDGIKMGTLSITVFDDTNASTRTGCMNGVEIFPVRLDVAPEMTDTTELEALIDEVEALNKYSYTPESWAVLAEALTTAKGQVNNLEATDETVAAAYQLLEEAKGQLELNGYDYFNPFDDASDTSGITNWGKDLGGNNAGFGFTIGQTDDGNGYASASVSGTGNRGSVLKISEEIVKSAEVSFDWMPITADNTNGEIMFLAPGQLHAYFVLRFVSSSYNIEFYTVNPLGGNTKQNEFEGSISRDSATATGLGGQNKWFNVSLEFDYLNHTADLTITDKANPENTFTQTGIPIEAEANGVKSLLLHQHRLSGGKNSAMGINDLTITFDKFGASDIVAIENPADVMVASVDYDEFEWPTEVKATLNGGNVVTVPVGEWTATPAFDEKTEAVYTWTAPLVTELSNAFNLQATFNMNYTLYPFPLRVYNPNTLELAYGEAWSGEFPASVQAAMSDGTIGSMEVGEWTPIREFNAEEEGIYVYGANVKATEGVSSLVRDQLSKNEQHVQGSDKDKYVYDVYYRISYFETADDYNAYARSMEYLDRGVYAVPAEEGIFVSWRLLVTEYGEDVAFNIKRNGEVVNAEPITSKTNYVDAEGKVGDVYTVVTVWNGKETESASVTALEQDYLAIPLQKPDPQPNASGGEGTYSINDAGAADVDGDGQYEIIVKWYPSNGFDSGNSSTKTSSPTIFDIYEMDGTALWRLNMGLEMPSGSHFNPFMLYDLDEDGKAELFVKTSDGTVSYKPNAEGKFDMDDESTIVSYIGDKSVVPGTNISSTGHATNGSNEYVTVFNGMTGEEIDTIDYVNEVVDNNNWGDNYGNRASRYNIAIAYLPVDQADENCTETIPAVLYNRGYYAKTTVAAYTLRDGKINTEWNFVAEGGSVYAGKGNHNMSSGDVDNDGFDELALGSIVIDHNGEVLWVKDGNDGRDYSGHADAIHLAAMSPDSEQLYLVTPAEDTGSTLNVSLTNAATGTRIAGEFLSAIDMGRGMAANITPTPGYEFWAQRPNSEIPNQVPTGAIYSFDGEVLATEKPVEFPANWRVYWDGDLLSELPDGNMTSNGTTANSDVNEDGILDQTQTVFKYNWEKNTLETLATFEGTSTNNGTKNSPNLSADLLGDWREEMVVRSADDTELRIYMTSAETDYMIYTLMHDPVYRNAVANQNTSYNQPPHIGFYLGEDNKDEVLAMKLPTANVVYTTGDVIEATEVTLDKTELTVMERKTATLTATVTPVDATYKTVTWSSDNEAVATVDDGVVTGVAVGTATITATTENGKTATCTVTVTERVSESAVYTFGNEYLAVKNFDTTALAETAIGETGFKAATATTNWNNVAVIDNNTADIGYWPIDDILPDNGYYLFVGTGGNSDSTATLTLPKTVSAGNMIKITFAKPVATNNGSARRSEANNVNTITVGSEVIDLQNDYEFSQWYTEIVTVDSDVSAITFNFGKWSAAAISEIEVIDSTDTLASKVTLDKTELSLAEGENATLTATISPEDTANKTLTWSTDNAAVATVADGVVTAVAEGTATITVTTSNGKTASCTVTVKKATVEATGVTLDKTEATVKVGDTVTLTATVAPEDATDKTLTWTTSDETKATVADGVVTAVAEGTATITVTTANGKTATCTVTVKKAAVDAESVTLDKTEATVKVGDTVTLTATVAPEDATDKTVTWTSSDETIATVADGVVTAVAEGKATITVTTANGKTATATITVEKKLEIGDVVEEWQKAPVQFVFDRGIMTGKGTLEDGTVKFDPNASLTREEFAQLLFAEEGKPEITTEKSFTDLVEGEWYVKAVLWAAENEIVSGVGDGSRFGVAEPITREQLALMLYKYAKLKGYDTTGSAELDKFVDANIASDWAVPSLKWAVANGVLSGAGDNLNPTMTATRAECAAMVRTFMEKFDK